MSGGAVPPRGLDPSLTDEQKKNVNTFIDNLENGRKYTKDESYRDLKHANEFFLQNSKDCKFVVEQLNTRKEFNRVAAAYNKNMHSAFILPVWAAAYSTEEDKGFVLYPRLDSLRTLFDDIERFNEEDKQWARRSILRHTFAPVALAIDTLHTPVANRRSMFYHRDISVDTVFLKTVEHHDVSRGHYRNAKLKLTELSTECFEYSHNMTNSLDLGLECKYFHHPDPWDTTKKYLKQHDWFSFGVFIVEVLTELAGRRFRRSADRSNRISFYEGAANELKSISSAELKERFGIDYKEHYERYADIAIRCLRSESGAFDLTLDHLTHQFEYGVGLQTAELLELHYDSRPSMYYEYDDPKAETLSECQACLLRKPVLIPTRSYRSGKKSRTGCAECDRFYCAQCHANGERLFCPLHKHGPTRTSIGGDAYFALILYGKEFNGTNPYAFKRDAENMRNVLMHSMICGIPISNIVLSALFVEDDQINSAGLLQEACVELKSKIAKKNDEFNYHLFVFYSGHGSEKNNGDWCPTDSDTLPHSDINNILSPLRGKKDILQNQSTIHESIISQAGSSGQVTYILDHCYPSSTDIGLTAVDREPIARLIQRPCFLGEAYLQKDGNSSVITDWLCNFFRSLFHKECDGECSECPMKPVDDHIAAKCHGSYLDAECFKKFMTLCPISDDDGGPVSEPTSTRGRRIIMAPYHPDGVHMKVFTFETPEAVDEQSGSGPFDIDFKETLDFNNLSKYIMGKMKMSTAADAYPRLCFLTNGVGTECSTEYDLVWESDVPHILALGSLNLERNSLSPSVLYYRVVDTPLQVTFKFGKVEDPSTYKLNLKLDKEETGELKTSCVPSLLVCMVHHLFLMYQNTARRLERQDSGEDDKDEVVLVDDYESDNHVVHELKRTEDSLRTSEDVRNSFADFLYNPRRRNTQLDTFRPSDWKHLAVQASKYDRGRGIFKIIPRRSMCIEW